MHILLYGNGSSGNHGCEAITRGTVALLGNAYGYTIHSSNCDDDIKYGLDSLAEIVSARQAPRKGLRFLQAYWKMKFQRNYLEMDGLSYLPNIVRAREYADIALSLGGDNYCYDGTEIYGWLNQAYKKAGVKTALWGCSVEPARIHQQHLEKDLACYSLIAARESITYEAVKNIQSSVCLIPDPAFFMEKLVCEVDMRLQSRPVIGINASPHIIKCETKNGMAYENYKQLIRYILSETDAIIALIPHVVWHSNDDRTVLRQLYQDFNEDPRLVLVEDHTAPELKYIISQCSFFVGARTHATIAAYSTCVPTLVVGYSVKARGIARDLFGSEQGYVLPVQELQTPDQLSAAFAALYGRRDALQLHLSQKLPSYLSTADTAVSMLKELASS